jgi:energy-coupling factor transporter ATP-binding protein EcfA2
MVRVRCENLTIRYPGSDRDALSDLNLACSPGRLLGILGPSGAGKSTLALALASLIPNPVPAAVRGVIQWTENARVPMTPQAVRRRCGIVTQDPWAQLTGIARTCGEEVGFGLSMLGMPRDSMVKRVRLALQELGIPDLECRDTSTLSGGELQRVILACFVALENELLVLDQPVSHLDLDGSTRLLDAVVRMVRQGRTIAFTDESAELAVRVCDDIGILSDGKLVHEGPRRTLSGSFGFEAHGIQTPLAMAVDQILSRGAGSSGANGCQAPPADWNEGRWVSHEASETPLISFADVGVQYLPGVWALRNVSFDIHRGEKVALIGHNGAGKTTTARVVVGLVPPLTGVVRLLGNDLRHWNPHEVAKKVGYAFQNPTDQVFKTSVRDEVAVGLKLLGLGGRQLWKRADEILATTGLESYARTHPYDLPDAKKRLLTIATAIAAYPRLLIVDEPTANLDFAAKLLVGDLVGRLAREGTSILAISHDVDFVAEYFQRVIVLHRGTVRADGPAAQVLTNRQLLTEASLDVPSPTKLWLERFRPSISTVSSTVSRVPLTRAELIATLRSHPG